MSVYYRFFQLGSLTSNDLARHGRYDLRGVANANSGILWCGIAGMMLSLLTGCGGGSKTNPTGEVYGKVTVGGQPLVEGRVNLTSKNGVGSGGDLKPDGSYTVDGSLPVGVYDVFITFNIPPAKVGTPAENVMKTVPPKYLSQAKSGLTAEVKKGRTEYNFDLK